MLELIITIVLLIAAGLFYFGVNQRITGPIAGVCAFLLAAVKIFGLL